jgi:hypothetical protein
VPELHPSFDKDFKIDTSGLLGRRRASVDHITRPAYLEGAVNNKNVASQPRRPRSASFEAASSTKKPSVFRRIKKAIFGPSTKDNSSASDQPKFNQITEESPKPYQPETESSRSNRSRAELSKPVWLRAKTPSRSPSPIASSKLPACRDSVYCLNQNSKDHTNEYSHPCRFNELCRRAAEEPHLVHERHSVSKCSQDRDCSEQTDPVHRAKFRHTNLPDYLIPCRFQEGCYNKSSEHRIKYFHGEELPSIKSKVVLQMIYFLI